MLKQAYAVAGPVLGKCGLGASLFVAIAMGLVMHEGFARAQSSPEAAEPAEPLAQPAAPPAPLPAYPPGYGPYPPAYGPYPPAYGPYPPAYGPYPGYPPPGYYYYPYGPPPGDTNAPPSSMVAMDAPTEDASPSPFTVAIDLGNAAVNETNATTVVLAPLVDGALVAHPALVLNLAWGFIAAIEGEGSAARLGNPVLTGTFRHDVGRWRLRAGLGITAPAASYPLGPDGRLYAFAYNQTMALWGLWNAWLWTPNRMAIPVITRIDRAIGSAASVRGELSVAPVLGVRNNASGTDTFAQLAVEVGFPIGRMLVLRPRLQIVILPSQSVDRSQTAAGLRGSLKTRYGDYFAGLLLNLDKPYGIFGGLGRWGLHVGKEMDL